MGYVATTRAIRDRNGAWVEGDARTIHHLLYLSVGPPHMKFKKRTIIVQLKEPLYALPWCSCYSTPFSSLSRFLAFAETKRAAKVASLLDEGGDVEADER